MFEYASLIKLIRSVFKISNSFAYFFADISSSSINKLKAILASFILPAEFSLGTILKATSCDVAFLLCSNY